MPWCDDCEKYWTPAAMRSDGTCPTCGRSVVGGALASGATAYTVDAERRAGDPTANPGGDSHNERDPDDDVGVPWHFKLMIVLLVIYLGYRFIEIGIKVFT